MEIAFNRNWIVSSRRNGIHRRRYSWLQPKRDVDGRRNCHGREVAAKRRSELLASPSGRMARTYRALVESTQVPYQWDRKATAHTQRCPTTAIQLGNSTCGWPQPSRNSITAHFVYTENRGSIFNFSNCQQTFELDCIEINTAHKRHVFEHNSLRDTFGECTHMW